MRTNRTLLAPAGGYLAAGALILAVPASALAFSGTAADATSPSAGGPGAVQARVSTTQVPYNRHEVGSRFALRHGAIEAIAGHSVTIAGRLLPAVAGRSVTLTARAGSGWQKLATARTGSRGHFRLRYQVPAPGTRQLRVSFAGDPESGPSRAAAGDLVGLREAVASWYQDAGNTACGFHATYGVANKTLPCGTKVTFVYGGRTVVATVDDRGPYVAGRDYDLDQNTAAALGMGGVATVLASV